MTATTWFCRHDSVYHCHPDCQAGKRAIAFGAIPGTNGKLLCLECARLQRSEGFTTDGGAKSADT